ncbi:MAG: prenyltransferase [Chloroflexi bacterium]|nr:prenyltransferase [Chloroflexota bacterium]
MALPRAWAESPLVAFIQLSRIKFLGGVLLLYLLGAAMAWGELARLDGAILILGLGATWATQLMTHYLNEYWDWETDRVTTLQGARTAFSGGSGVLADGLLPRSVALWAGAACTLLALTLGAVLVATLQTGPYTLALLAISLGVGYFYSSPPLRLQARGVGEAATSITVGMLVPAGAYYLQTGQFSPTLTLATLPLAFTLFAMVLGVHLPDYDADRATGKLNLVARLGPRRAARLAGISILAGYLLNGLETGWGLVPPMLATMQLSAPLALIALIAMLRLDQSETHLRAIPFWGVALFASASAAVLLGMLLA